MSNKSVRKKSSWKDIQYKTKIKKRSKLALFILGLLGALLLLSFLLQLGKILFSSWRSSSPNTRNYVWSGEFNISLAIHSNAVSILSYNPREEKAVIINIPDETFLEVPHGFGKWQLRAVYELGQAKLLKETLTHFLGLPIDGFLDFSPPFANKDAFDLVEILRKNPFSGASLLPSLRTDLTLWEMVKLKFSLEKIRFDKVEQINLSKAMDGETLPDGTRVLTADPAKLDSVLAGLVDPAIVSEHKTIAVLNATGKPQLAKEAARVITSLGGNVIVAINAKERLKTTKIAGRRSQTLKRLWQIFAIRDKIDDSGDNLEVSRAEINVWLGEDYAD